MSSYHPAASSSNDREQSSAKRGREPAAKPAKKRLAQKGVGTPVKILHEAVDLVVSVELNSGETYRGTLVEMEDNMNCQLQAVTVTARDGQTSKLERVFLRGSQIVFFVIPDMLAKAPMFTQQSQGLGLGRIRAKHTPSSAPAAKKARSTSSK